MSWGRLLALAASCALFAQSALAEVTVYGQAPLGATRTIQPGATWTGLPAYDPTILTPPVISPLPSPYFLQLTNDVTAVGGVSIPMKGTFYGFSIEVSVVNQIREFTQRLSLAEGHGRANIWGVVGKNASFIQVPFLNLMSTLASRGGEVHVRIGGNTQDYATLVDSIDQGRVIEKLSDDLGNPTDTPPLIYTRGLFYMMSNISNFVPVKWYLGQHLFPESFILSVL